MIEDLDLHSLSDTVQCWAREAGAIHMNYFRSGDLGISTKTNSFDVVTRADKEAEALIKSHIHHLYPEHCILAEESGEEAHSSPWRWVIDPLDGTTNYSVGLPIFCVSIALEYEEKPVLGVVYAPYLDEMFTAVRGSGARLNGRTLVCSQKNKLSEAVVSTGLPVDKNINTDNNMEAMKRVGLAVRGLRRLGSAAMDLCYTAAGILDGFWELALHRWDIAAGSLIAEEAGAKVTYYRPDRPYSIIASGPYLHSQLSELVG